MSSVIVIDNSDNAEHLKFGNCDRLTKVVLILYFKVCVRAYMLEVSSWLLLRVVFHAILYFRDSASADGPLVHLSHLRNECLFFWVHGVWIVARDKQIAWTAKRFSCDLFVPRYDSFPMNPDKKTLIPYIYNASNKDLF